jgi:hypothetical protein
MDDNGGNKSPPGSKSQPQSPPTIVHTGESSAKEIVSELRKGELCSEKAIVSCSRQASSASFAKEFVSLGGLTALLTSLQLVNQQRSTKSNVLRALTLMLEDKWSRLAFPSIVEQNGISVGLLTCLLGLVTSDSAVLTVARALHVLAVVTEPGVVAKAALRKAFEDVAAEQNRKLLVCLRPAFVGFALLDANLHGLTVLKNMLTLDATYLKALEEAQLLQALFPLCENEALTNQLVEFQVSQVKCWRDRASVPVNTELAQHCGLLERLWLAVGSAKPFPGRSSAEWKQLGFQSDR